MEGLNLTSVITLNVNGVNTSINRDWQSDKNTLPSFLLRTRKSLNITE